MKTCRLISLVCITLLVSKPLYSSVHSHIDVIQNSNPHYIVVIGAFAVKQNAERFTTRVKSQNYEAKYEFNPDRGLYYVFTLTTNDKARAMEEARRLREETSFSDAWVYQGTIGLQNSLPGKDIDPVTETVVENIQETIAHEPIVEETKEPEVQETSPLVTAEGKKFLFEFFNTTDNRPVKGEVEAIDVDRARKITTLKTNAPVYLPSPKNNSGKVSLVTDAFGYRKAQVDIDYNNPSGDEVTLDEKDGVVVRFGLVRLRKGDIVVMYNVFFFKDAAVMMPESKFEVTSLLEMMKENPKNKIRIHGHTNGNASGKIIYKGEEQNFFSLDGARESNGSAKALSEARASIIRDYLIANGIEPARMEIKAWGGKKSLYDKESARAKENVRVEVEILEE